MNPRRGAGRRLGGFTVIELLVALIVSGIVVFGVLTTLLSQSQNFTQQLGITDASETLRGAGGLLSWEVRHAAMGSDTVFSTSADTLSLRSVQSVGVVCAEHATQPRFGIWMSGGGFQATSGDTALVYSFTKSAWRKARIAQVGTAAAMGVTSCSWAGRAPDLVVELEVASPADTSGIRTGSIFRSFRSTRFAEIQSRGRWWLGRSVGGGGWEITTGPLLPPANGGLQLTYYDSTGAVTTTKRNVRTVGITLRSQSYRQYVGAGDVSAYRGDSLTTRIQLRR